MPKPRAPFSNRPQPPAGTPNLTQHIDAQLANTVAVSFHHYIGSSDGSSHNNQEHSATQSTFQRLPTSSSLHQPSPFPQVSQSPSSQIFSIHPTSQNRSGQSGGAFSGGGSGPRQSIPLVSATNSDYESTFRTTLGAHHQQSQSTTTVPQRSSDPAHNTFTPHEASL
ncbi:hypothetical protein K435DRAFT_862108 [Dendrothele bispora CBS 962.96]|uniref:Uncharacterized protein n=1 Tax=Dendrothele bispora (strain CBS 962.96) TaxID=1314807 RepID=A0A4V4HEX6_DENBC|nr:hypothetical protein K435DRAFT_862108 [Dendrothele bispora CBS 962.96]